MEELLRRYFSLETIEDPRRLETKIATRVGYLELLPGGVVSYWIVLDHQHSRDGFPVTSEVVAKFALPIETNMMSRPMVNAWFAHHGLNVPVRPPLLDGPTGKWVM